MYSTARIFIKILAFLLSKAAKGTKNAFCVYAFRHAVQSKRLN